MSTTLPINMDYPRRWRTGRYLAALLVSILLHATLRLFLPGSAALPAARRRRLGKPACDRCAAWLHGGGGASGLLVVDAETGKAALRAGGQTRQRPLASNMKLFTTATALSRFGPEATDRDQGARATARSTPAASCTAASTCRAAATRRSARPAFYDRFLGGLGTNLYALQRADPAAGIDRGHRPALRRRHDLRPPAAASPTPATRPAPTSARSPASPSTPATRGSTASSFASDPAKLAASKLARSLRAAGVEIRPGSRSATPTPADARPDRAWSAPPRSTPIVNTTDVYSNNFFAEMLIKLLGADFGGAGTTAAGAAVVEDFARGHGSGVHAVDGSGLTRAQPRLAAAGRATCCWRCATSPVGDDFIEDLALAGQRGHGRRPHATAPPPTAAAGPRPARSPASATSPATASTRSGRMMVFSILMGERRRPRPRPPRPGPDRRPPSPAY